MIIIGEIGERIDKYKPNLQEFRPWLFRKKFDIVIFDAIYTRFFLGKNYSYLKIALPYPLSSSEKDKLLEMGIDISDSWHLRRPNPSWRIPVELLHFPKCQEVLYTKDIEFRFRHDGLWGVIIDPVRDLEEWLDA